MVAHIALVLFTHTPFSAHPPMDFESTPALQTVNSGAYFTETGTVTDNDTFLTDGQAGTEHTLPNTDLVITETLRSGTLQSTNSSLVNGRCTKTVVIKALTVSVDTLKVDDWIFTDTGTLTLLKDAEKLSQNSVLIKAPESGSGTGSNGGG